MNKACIFWRMCWLKFTKCCRVTEKRWLHKRPERELQDERKKRSAEFENLLEAVRELAQKNLLSYIKVSFAGRGKKAVFTAGY